MIKIGGCFSCNVRTRPFSQNQRELKICSLSIFLLSKSQVIMVQCGWYKTAIYCILWAGQEIKVKKCSLSVMSVTVELPSYCFAAEVLEVNGVTTTTTTTSLFLIKYSLQSLCPQLAKAIQGGYKRKKKIL